MAPMGATARTIRLIAGDLGCMAEPTPAVWEGEPGGHAKTVPTTRPRRRRTSGADSLCSGVTGHRRQREPRVKTSVIDADGTLARGWQRRGPMLRCIDAAPHTGAASATPARRRDEPPEGPDSDGASNDPSQPATATDDEPDDRAMRVVEVGLALFAIVAAGILALLG